MNNMNRPQVNMRRTLRMNTGGSPFDQMLERNPGVVANRAASPSPGLTTPAAAAPVTYQPPGVSPLPDAAAARANTASQDARTLQTMQETNALRNGTPAQTSTSKQSRGPVGANTLAMLSSNQNMAVPQLRNGGDLGTSIGEYWSGDNAKFEAGNPGMMARVGRSLNPMTGLGSAVGAMHDGASKGSFRDMGIAVAQAVPAFAAAKTAKTIAGPMTVVDGAKTAKHVAAVSAGSAGVDKAQAAGLRNGGDLETGHGGDVPGEGKGDKIKALYEPGEFVVSNAMLKAQPGLRDQLHSLRGNVLASQGKSVEQADAEAVSGKTLRANDGLTKPPGRAVAPYVNHVFGDNAAKMASSNTSLVAPSQPGYKPNFTMGSNAPLHDAIDMPSRTVPDGPKYTKPSVDPTTGRYTHESISGRSSGVQSGVGGQPSVQAGQAGPSVQVGSPTTQPQGTGAGAGSGSRPGVFGSLRQGVSNFGAGLGQQTNTGKLTYLAGSALKPVAALANSTLGKAAGVAGVVNNFNDYKLNDPDVDSSASGTIRSLSAGDFSGAGRSLSKGALEAGMDLGSFAANTADVFVPGQGPSTAYNKMLRDKFGDQLTDQSGNNTSEATVNSTPTSPKYTARPDSVTPWGNEGNRKLSNINAPGGNIRGTEDFTKVLNTQPANLPAGLRDGMVYKTKDAQGRVTYSGRNVSGDVSNKMLNGDGTSAGKMRGNLDVVAPGSIGLTQNGFAGTPVAANPEARAAQQAAGQAKINASLRNPDGTNWSANDNAVMAANLRDGIDPYIGTSRQTKIDDAPKRGEFGYKNYMANKQKDADRAVTERGHELEMERARMTQGTAQQRLRFDMERGIREEGRAQATHDQTLTEKFRENYKKEFTIYDKEGKPDQQASGQMADMARRVFPGIEGADEKTRNASMADAKELMGIFNKARDRDKVGFDALKFWEPKRPELRGMPDVLGGKTRELNGLDGLITLGTSNGDTILTKDGHQTNLGRLNARQLELLKSAQQKGWGN